MLGTWQFGNFVTLGKMTFWTYCHHGHNIFWAFYHPGHFVILGLNVIWAFWLWAICHTWAFCHLGHFNIQSNIIYLLISIFQFCFESKNFMSHELWVTTGRTSEKANRIQYMVLSKENAVNNTRKTSCILVTDGHDKKLNPNNHFSSTHQKKVRFFSPWILFEKAWKKLSILIHSCEKK